MDIRMQLMKFYDIQTIKFSILILIDSFVALILKRSVKQMILLKRRKCMHRSKVFGENIVRHRHQQNCAKNRKHTFGREHLKLTAKNLYHFISFYIKF